MCVCVFLLAAYTHINVIYIYIVISCTACLINSHPHLPLTFPVFVPHCSPASASGAAESAASASGFPRRGGRRLSSRAPSSTSGEVEVLVIPSSEQKCHGLLKWLAVDHVQIEENELHLKIYMDSMQLGVLAGQHWGHAWRGKSAESAPKSKWCVCVCVCGGMCGGVLSDANIPSLEAH